MDEVTVVAGNPLVATSYPSAITVKQSRCVIKLFRLTSTRMPNFFGERTRNWTSVASTGNTCTLGARSNAGQKGICTVAVIASAGNSIQNVPSRRSVPSAVLERIICCRRVSSIGTAETGFGNFFVVSRRDSHSTARSSTRKMLIKLILANGGRQTVPMTAQKHANQKGKRMTCKSTELGVNIHD